MTSRVRSDDLKKHRIGWIGTGRMGFPLAARLLKKGCDLAAYNRVAPRTCSRWSPDRSGCFRMPIEHQEF